MKSLKKLLTVSTFVFLCFGLLTAGEIPTEAQFYPGCVLFKVHEDMRINISLEGENRTGMKRLDQFLDQINTTRIERTFPHCLPPKPGGTDLSRWFTLSFPTSISVEQVCNDLIKFNEIEYAEPWYIYRYYLDHNDPMREDQYALDNIEANRAHDISTGDKAVGVAIIDMGIDMDHDDLEGNLWINPGEDLNGDGVIQDNERNRRDDDDNGNVDDFYGWDLVDDDNYADDPGNVPQMSGHGVHCAGLASAVTNNEIGIASVGYRCGIIPVRVSDMRQDFGPQGIEYAARVGAKVISCSWGPPNEVQAIRDAVDYAYENDALVVAAAGNLGGFPPIEPETPIYPAAYDNVIAVAGTDQDDHLWENSNYGNWVNISAPGEDILSTYLNNDYYVASGTSMATPLVAGVAVLIRATYPELTVDETRDLLLRGADNIDDINRQYLGKFGSGRVNIYNSLMLGRIVITEVDIRDDDGNGQLEDGEVAEIVVTVFNNTNSPQIEELLLTLNCNDPAIDIIEGEIRLADIDSDSSVSNEDSPMQIQAVGDIDLHTACVTLRAIANPDRFVAQKILDIEVAPLSVPESGDNSPLIFELVSAFPNPFNSSVMLHYNLYKAGMTQVRIIDIFGREVALFNRYYQTAGQQRFEWDGKNSLGMIVSSGTYFVRIDFEGQSRLLKLLLLR